MIKMSTRKHYRIFLILGIISLSGFITLLPSATATIDEYEIVAVPAPSLGTGTELFEQNITQDVYVFLPDSASVN